MNQQNKNLSAEIAGKTGKMTPLAIQGLLDQWKRVHFPKLAALAKNRDEAERLYTICMNTISKNPKLLECTFESIATCILTSFQLNLYPGPMQECAYVPFAGVATFMPQYQGITKLCYNSGFIKSISCNVVWEGEHFRYAEGLYPVLEHVPDLDLPHSNDPKEARRMCAYCVIKTRYDDVQVSVLSPRFIAGIKARSKGASKADSPWNGGPDDVDWMWKKTALKQALKLIPKSAEVANVIDLDNAIESEEKRGGSVIDLTLNAGAAGPMQPPEQHESAGTTEGMSQQNNAQGGPAKALPHDARASIELPKQEAATVDAKVK